MVPICSESYATFESQNYFKMLVYTLKLSAPAAYCWLLGFYSLFHSWLNILGEITYFSDRRFYNDWWNAGNLGEYWRKWNMPVHNFLIRHIYYPCRRADMDKSMAMLMTFFVSAAVHEYLVSFNLVLFCLDDRDIQGAELCGFYSYDGQCASDRDPNVAKTHHLSKYQQHHVLALLPDPRPAFWNFVELLSVQQESGPFCPLGRGRVRTVNYY
jgi:hypothetical protein